MIRRRPITFTKENHTKKEESAYAHADSSFAYSMLETKRSFLACIPAKNSTMAITINKAIGKDQLAFASLKSQIVLDRLLQVNTRTIEQYRIIQLLLLEFE